MADDIILRWTGSKYIGIDPSDGSQVPLPFGDVEFDTLEAVSQETDLIGSLSQDKYDNKLVLDDNGDPGFLKFQKRSNNVGDNPPQNDNNTAIVYCESGELVAMDQVGNLTQIT